MDGQVTLWWVFVLDGRYNMACAKGSVRRAEKRCGGSNLVAIQVCCVWLRKGLDDDDDVGRRSEGNLEGWLVKHTLKLSRRRRLCFMRGSYERVGDEGGVPGITTEPARLKGDETRRT